MKKIKIPDDMLKAAIEQAYESGKLLNRHQWTTFFSSGSGDCVKFTKAILEAAIRWIMENPIVPTNKDVDELWQIGRKILFTTKTSCAITDMLVEWQRRMFLASDDPSPLVMYIMRHFEDGDDDKESLRNRAEAAAHDFMEHQKRNRQ